MNTTVHRCIVLALVGLVAWSALAPLAAMAEAPRYEPYGAWRGRIRYVEGPRRVRTHIRWSNGITPVGGQVLMHLATVAGNVATNENFLNAVNPIRREADPQLVSAVNQLGEKNKDLVKALNAVRTRPDIKLSELVLKVDVAAVTPPPNGGGPMSDATALLSQRDSFLASIQKNRTELGTQIHHAAATGDNVVAASAPQQTQRDLLKAFLAKDIIKDIAAPVPLAPPTTLAAFDESIKSIKLLSAATIGVLKDAINVDGQLLQADPTADEDSKKAMQAEIETLKKFLADLEGLNL